MEEIPTTVCILKNLLSSFSFLWFEWAMFWLSPVVFVFQRQDIIYNLKGQREEASFLLGILGWPLFKLSLCIRGGMVPIDCFFTLINHHFILLFILITFREMPPLRILIWLVTCTQILIHDILESSCLLEVSAYQSKTCCIISMRFRILSFKSPPSGGLI